MVITDSAIVLPAPPEPIPFYAAAYKTASFADKFGFRACLCLTRARSSFHLTFSPVRSVCDCEKECVTRRAEALLLAPLPYGLPRIGVTADNNQGQGGDNRRPCKEQQPVSVNSLRASSSHNAQILRLRACVKGGSCSRATKTRSCTPFLSKRRLSCATLLQQKTRSRGCKNKPLKKDMSLGHVVTATPSSQFLVLQVVFDWLFDPTSKNNYSVKEYNRALRFLDEGTAYGGTDLIMECFLSPSQLALLLTFRLVGRQWVDKVRAFCEIHVYGQRRNLLSVKEVTECRESFLETLSITLYSQKDGPPPPNMEELAEYVVSRGKRHDEINNSTHKTTRYQDIDPSARTSLKKLPSQAEVVNSLRSLGRFRHIYDDNAKILALGREPIITNGESILVSYSRSTRLNVNWAFFKIFSFLKPLGRERGEEYTRSDDYDDDGPEDPSEPADEWSHCRGPNRSKHAKHMRQAFKLVTLFARISSRAADDTAEDFVRVATVKEHDNMYLVEEDTQMEERFSRESKEVAYLRRGGSAGDEQGFWLVAEQFEQLLGEHSIEAVLPG